MPVAFSAKDCNVNLASQTLELAGLDADAAGAHITGSLTGAEILDAPKLKGSIKLDPLSLREWLPKLGIDAPQTTDPNVLKQLSFAGNVLLTKSSAEVGDIVMKLDDTTMRGMLGVADFAAKALRFDLNVDRIDADRYLPPPPEKPAAKDAKEPPTEIPVEMLRKLNARGQLSVGEAIFAGIKFTKLRLGVNAREGKARFYPSEASMYGGQYRGDIGIDSTGNVARVTLDEHVTGVNFAPLFKDMFETERVSGKGSANIKLAGSGRTTDDVMKTLDGTVDFKVADGALEGADLWYEIRRARALLKQQAIPERPSGPPRTPFSALTGTGTMNDGVLKNDDLNVAMQYLKVTGQGSSRSAAKLARLSPGRRRAEDSARGRGCRADAGHGGRADSREGQRRADRSEGAPGPRGLPEGRGQEEGRGEDQGQARRQAEGHLQALSRRNPDERGASG